MKKILRIVFLTGLLLGGWSLSVQAAPLQAPTAYEVIAVVNAMRASYGLDPYLVDGLLMISAQAQADYLASMYSGAVNGHVGPGGTDATTRALAVGFPNVEGLHVNENWASLPESITVEELVYDSWGDADHLHNTLHPQGQMVGVGVASANDQYYYIMNIAVYWGDAGLTPQPTNMAFGENAATQQYVSQYIAPVIKAEPRADGSIIHKVQSGQSLWMLADHYDVDINSLRNLNGLNSTDMIYIGQEIMIRAAVTPTPTGSVTAAPTARQKTATSLPATPFTPYPLNTQAAGASDTSLDFSFWFLIFFALFGLGLILIMVGMGQNK